MIMKIDLTASPMSLNELAAIRQQDTYTLALVAKRERVLNFAVLALYITALLGVWHMRHQTEAETTLMVTATLMMTATAIIIRKSTVLLILIWAPITAFFAPLQSAMTLIVPIISTIAAWALREYLIDAHREQAEYHIALLSPLVESDPHPCIDWMALVDSDATVRTYQDQLQVMGRRPIMAELEAARVWADNADRRKKLQEHIEAAKDAITRMDGNSSITPHSS